MNAYITIKKNSNSDAFVLFSEEVNEQWQCISNKKEIQNAFILSILEKEKRITILKGSKVPEQIDELRKHFKVTDETISIQKSYYKFFSEKIKNRREEELSFELIKDILT